MSGSLYDPDRIIAAPSTPPGTSGIAVIRLSGNGTIDLVQRCFSNKSLREAPSHTLHVGIFQDGEEGIDEVVVGIFRAPKSYTMEDVAEISCHGSPVVVQRILQTLLKAGALLAAPGEFTRRAFLNGRFDLAQAEAVADLIHSETDNARLTALNQMRGGFSSEIRKLREELIHFASLLELELDFGEEDVEFADRKDLEALIERIQSVVQQLMDSFRAGNVIRNGVPTVIAGRPNAGKSTLLNALLKEDKAIVSEIPGTTRDVIEDEIELDGIRFRFIDTAGIRETTDTVEAMGVGRTHAQLKKAALILHVGDATQHSAEDLTAQAAEFESLGIPVIHILNKVDRTDLPVRAQLEARGFISISASSGKVTELEKEIVKRFHIEKVRQGDVIVTNARHYESLRLTYEALGRSLHGLRTGLTGDFIAMDVRQSLHHLGEITGTITTEDLLANIFGKFCIGK